METSKPFLGTLLNRQIRYVVPVFQRHYVWTEEYQWKPLWEDIQTKIQERLTSKKLHPHYTGSIVLNQEMVTTDVLATYSVIDGQQRLTTFQIFLIAFREVCRHLENSEVLISTINKYIFNEPSFGDTDFDRQKYKLVPTKSDIDSYRDLADLTYDELFKKRLQPILDEKGIGPKTYRDEAKKRDSILGAYIYFYDAINTYFQSPTNEISQSDLIKTTLLTLQNDFQFVEIGLSGNDDPQMIFETLNGRGASLTETDLIRNYIFMRADTQGDALNKIYEKYWDEYDDPKASFAWHHKISRGRYSESRLQFFLIDYLTLKLKEEIRYDQVFYRYKSFIINNEPFNSIEGELSELYKYSRIFKKLTTPTHNTHLEIFAIRLLAMDMTTIYPLLMFIEGAEIIPNQQKTELYKILDSYITRRFICGYTTKNYNNVFLELLNFLIKKTETIDIDLNNLANIFSSHLITKDKDTNLWPNDFVLQKHVLERKIYLDEKGKQKALVNLLLEIEYANRAKKQESIQINPSNLTIEHFLPQNWFQHWPLDNKSISEEDFENAHNAVVIETDPNGHYHQIMNRNSLLHTIGNLTLLTSSLNPSVSNAGFAKKKTEVIKHSSLVMNAYFQEMNEWNEQNIKERGQKLYASIINIWPYPQSLISDA